MKILKKILFTFFLFFPLSTLAISMPIEKVFKDIDSDYKYYEELQTMYNKGMFFPDDNGNFNPKKLISREEFVGVVSEITCKKCIKPDVSLDYIEKYFEVTPFFDVFSTSKYFYCISLAKDLGKIKGYTSGTFCENGSGEKGKIPFCPKNTITLEEALSILLRSSDVITDEKAINIRTEIHNGNFFPDLAKDLKPKLNNGDIYFFYPYFKEALNYKLIEYDTFGNKKNYKLLEKKGDFLYPRKAITKEEFLRMTYILFKGNSCINNEVYNIPLQIDVLDKNCDKKNIKNCKKANLNLGKTFDIFANTTFSDKDKTSSINQYIWRFYDYNTEKEIIKYGKYVDNYNFTDSKYRVYLIVKTDNGDLGRAYLDLDFEYNLRTYIGVKPPFYVGENISFLGNTTNNINIKNYNWNFGDGNFSNIKNAKHIYTNTGTYDVYFNVIDKNNNLNSSSITINVKYKDSSDLDSDSDGIINDNDLCPLIFGNKLNSGCPIFEKKCNSDSNCPNGQICKDNFCFVKNFATNCDYSGGNLFYGNVVCDSCPCNYNIDFNAAIRKCDIIFPSITSPNETKIYSKGDFFQVGK